jgi:Domain of Unknown Function with PDB structure (DUF3865)
MNFNNLNQVMFADYIAVNINKNPFSRLEKNLSKNELEIAITQYSLFPKNIISFFVTALYNLNFHRWKDISSELVRNLNEELGHPYENEEHEKFMYRPHYVILREGILNGLEIDIKNTIPNEHTNSFLAEIKKIVDNDKPAIVAGATFALESSAIPELKIISSLTERLFELSNKPMPDSLKEFFCFHIDEIEVGHRDRLLETCSKYIKTDDEMNDFENGFRQVLATMDIWWTGLNKAILLNGPTYHLRQINTEREVGQPIT